MSAEKLITKRPNGTRRVQTVNGLPSRTQKQHKDQVNVNNIMKKFKKTGSITHLRNAKEGVYADLTQITDYAESLMQIKKADEAFLSIPSEIRNKFQNNPANLISYLKDPKNTEEAIKHGLLVKRENDEQKPNPNDENAKQPIAPLQTK